MKFTVMEVGSVKYLSLRVHECDRDHRVSTRNLWLSGVLALPRQQEAKSFRLPFSDLFIFRNPISHLFPLDPSNVTPLHQSTDVTVNDRLAAATCTSRP